MVSKSKEPKFECIMCIPTFDSRPKFHTYDALQEHIRKEHFGNLGR